MELVTALHNLYTAVQATLDLATLAPFAAIPFLLILLRVR